MYFVLMAIRVTLAILITGVIIYLTIRRRHDQANQNNEMPLSLNQMAAVANKSHMINYDDDQKTDLKVISSHNTKLLDTRN